MNVLMEDDGALLDECVDDEPCWMNVLMEPCWMNVLMEDDGALLDECVDGG